MSERNRPIICKDGFQMSVQAHDGAYCTPRIDGAEKYISVEVGYPNEREPLLMRWAESPGAPCNTVYGYVPIQVIVDVCAKHGGIVEGKLPPGIPYLEAQED
jgi:hypothetical protein